LRRAEAHLSYFGESGLEDTAFALSSITSLASSWLVEFEGTIFADLPITIMLVPALDKALPLESVSPTSFQQVPQAGPAPAPGAAPYRFWDTAAEKPGEVKKPQAAVFVWQLGEPKESPAP